MLEIITKPMKVVHGELVQRGDIRREMIDGDGGTEQEQERKTKAETDGLFREGFDRK